jgi:hypothetical protein
MSSTLCQCFLYRTRNREIGVHLQMRDQIDALFKSPIQTYRIRLVDQSVITQHLVRTVTD